MSNPSPMSRSNFRERRLTYANRTHMRINAETNVISEKNVFSAGEVSHQERQTRPLCR